MGDYNIIQWVEKLFNDQELKLLVEIYNEQTGSNISLALLPFVNHDAMTKAVQGRIDDMVGPSAATSNPQTLEPTNEVQILRDKLDEDQYWVDVTTIGDMYRKEYNTVTEAVRMVDRLSYDDEIFGNVRSSL